MPIEWLFNKLGPTVRGVVALVTLCFVVYVVFTEYNARQIRKELRDMAIEHNRETAISLEEHEVTKEFLQQSERRNDTTLKVLTDMAKSMSDMTELQRRILSPKPKVTRSLKMKAPHRKGLKQCSVKGTRQTRIGNNTVEEEVLIPIPCR